jgi:flagella basal body P-ring formation protein FlgA
MFSRAVASVLLTVSAGALLFHSAWAQSQLQGQVQGPAPGPVANDALVVSVQRWVDEAMAKSATDLPLRMEVVVGESDSRLRLAPCARTENYLPPSTRLWGRSRIGVRCVDGVARWNIFVPVTVKAFGEAWVVKAGVAPGAVLTPNDAVLAEVDWAEDANAVLADPALWVKSRPELWRPGRSCARTW